MSAGTYGTLQYGKLPSDYQNLILDNLDTWGTNFAEREEEAVVAEESPQPPSLNSEELRAQARALIDNSLEFPDEIVQQAKEMLRSETSELRDYLMTAVVPFLLSVNPALTSVKAMTSRMFDSQDVEVDVDLSALQSFAHRMAILSVQHHVMTKLNLPEALKERVFNRIMPPPEQRPSRSVGGK